MGTHLVAMPVTFAIITSMVAFVPMLFLPGWLGKLMKDIPLVVIPALLFLTDRIEIYPTLSPESLPV